VSSECGLENVIDFLPDDAVIGYSIPSFADLTQCNIMLANRVK